MARLIDAADNEFVISNPKSGATELLQDLRLISDLVVVFVAAALGALFFSQVMGLPSAIGYIAGGSLVGPGGLKLVGELVQVATLAQLGVLLPLFSRGAELAAAAKAAERNVGGGDGLGLGLGLGHLCGTSDSVYGSGVSTSLPSRSLLFGFRRRRRGGGGRRRRGGGSGDWRRAALSGVGGASALATFSALLAPTLGATPPVVGPTRDFIKNFCLDVPLLTQRIPQHQYHRVLTHP